MENLDTYSSKVELDDSRLKLFCARNGLEYHELDLQSLHSSGTNASTVPKYFFIYTGSEKNSANEGNTHHWMFCYGNYIFDSYGSLETRFKVPEQFRPVKTFPRRLQSFDSDVCGEYCCAFYSFVSHEQEKDFANLGQDFCNAFEFTQDTDENDKKVLQWFKENSTGNATTGRQGNESASDEEITQ